VRQSRDLLVQGGPGRQLPFVMGAVGRVAKSAIPWCGRGVLSTGTLRAEIVPGQIDEHAAKLLGRQTDELTDRTRCNRFERLPELETGLLANVGRFLPAAYAGKALQHLPGQHAQPTIGTANEMVARPWFSRLQPVNPELNLAAAPHWRIHGDLSLGLGAL